MKKKTLVNHPPKVHVPGDNRPLVDPIYQSVKFTFDEVGETQRYWRRERDGFYYSRSSNPTLTQLERVLAELQGREDCLVTGSGIAAFSIAMLALLKAGDHMVFFTEMYQPSRVLIQRILRRFGVSSTMLSVEDHSGLERALREKPTRLLAFESPTNPAVKIADLQRITAIARQNDVLTVIDNTLAGVHNHGQFDVDVFVHSLTKYAAGHGDVLGGAIIGSHELIRAMRADATLLGPALDPHAAFLILRGLKTYVVRWQAQCSNAQRIAEFLQSHPAVERVSYPGLPGDPGHALAVAQMDGFGAVVTFDLRAGTEAGSRFADALELFAITASLGSTDSLVVAPAMQAPRGLTEQQRAWSAIGPGTVRLSIGLEDADDLIADLAQALQKAEA